MLKQSNRSGGYLVFAILLGLLLVLSGCQPPGSAGADAAPINPLFKFVAETVWFVLMSAFIYFMLVTRPKQERETAHYKFIKEAKKGDKVFIKPGIFGKIHSISDDSLSVEIASNVRVKVKPSIVEPLHPTKNDAKNSPQKNGESKK